MFLSKEVLVSRGLEPIELPGLEQSSEPYIRKYFTFAHQVLDLESLVKPVDEICYRKLDELLARCQATIALKDASDPLEATGALQAIERILMESNFICAIPFFLVDTLSQALTPVPLNPRLINSQENALRREHILAHQGEMFHCADCDTYSAIYLAVGELLQFPIRIADLPGHTFVRWHLSETRYINWETNFGFTRFNDDDYRGSAPVQSRPPLSLSSIISGLNLRSFPPQEALAYYMSLQTAALAQNGNLELALQVSLRSLELSPRHPVVANNAAWAFVAFSGTEFRHLEERALLLAKMAVEADSDPNVIDTLATVQAALGNFAEAAELEEGVGRSVMAGVYRARRTFLQHQADKSNIVSQLRAGPAEGMTADELQSQTNLSQEVVEATLVALEDERKVFGDGSSGILRYLLVGNFAPVLIG